MNGQPGGQVPRCPSGRSRICRCRFWHPSAGVVPGFVGEVIDSPGHRDESLGECSAHQLARFSSGGRVNREDSGEGSVFENLVRVALRAVRSNGERPCLDWLR